MLWKNIYYSSLINFLWSIRERLIYEDNNNTNEGVTRLFIIISLNLILKKKNSLNLIFFRFATHKELFSIYKIIVAILKVHL